MSFNVAALTAYIDEQSRDLLKAAHFGNKTSGLLTPMTAVKLSRALQIFSADATRQADSCGHNANGTAVFTQRVMTVAALKFEDDLCLKDLIPKWTQILLLQGSNEEEATITFADDLMMDILDNINEESEDALWKGDTGSGTPFLAFYDGLLKIIDAASPVSGNTSGTNVATGITNTNALDLVTDMVDAMPREIKLKNDLTLFVGTDTYDKYTTNLRNENLFHHVASTDAYSSIIPSKQIPIEGVPGLDTTNRMILARRSNLFQGMDLASDEDEFRLWYSMDDAIMKYRIKFKQGTQIAFGGEIVQFTLVP